MTTKTTAARKQRKPKAAKKPARKPAAEKPARTKKAAAHTQGFPRRPHRNDFYERRRSALLHNG